MGTPSQTPPAAGTIVEEGTLAGPAAGDLVRRWTAGDATAADELFERYFRRLVGLVRPRLSAGLHRRVDAEDIIQSVYRSFFERARGDRFVFERSGDLWRLLVAMSMNKLHHAVEFHTAGKRNFRREQAPGNTDTPPPDPADPAPTPDDAAALADAVECLLNSLEEPRRQIVQLRLQGEGVEEIAAAVGRSARTVRRTLEQLREQLRQEATP